MVNTRLYLPKEWTEDKKRCDKAGIPLQDQEFKTKPKLALEMLKEAQGVIEYDWVGGDAVCGVN
ncbi:MAG: transposase [Lewinellaceae bacterium]|nr:transposase [Lewinellaceae bacterium]